MFNIDKGLPIPEQQGRSGNTKYHFGKMEIGDSFEIGRDPIVAKRVRAAAARFASYQKNGMRFSTRKDGCAWRVWRVL